MMLKHSYYLIVKIEDKGEIIIEYLYRPKHGATRKTLQQVYGDTYEILKPSQKNFTITTKSGEQTALSKGWLAQTSLFLKELNYSIPVPLVNNPNIGLNQIRMKRLLQRFQNHHR